MQFETLDFVRFLKTKMAKSENVMKRQEFNGSEVVKIMIDIAAAGQ